MDIQSRIVQDNADVEVNMDVESVENEAVAVARADTPAGLLTTMTTI